jgi:hypothetical protein
MRNDHELILDIIEAIDLINKYSKKVKKHSMMTKCCRFG